MSEILDIAVADYTAKKTASIATITVTDWKQNGQPVKLAVMKVGAAEKAEIDSTRKTHGDLGAQVMTIIKRCYLDSDKTKRAFVDTDFQILMNNVDPDVLKTIYKAIKNAEPGGE